MTPPSGPRPPGTAPGLLLALLVGLLITHAGHVDGRRISGRRSRRRERTRQRRRPHRPEVIGSSSTPRTPGHQPPVPEREPRPQPAPGRGPPEDRRQQARRRGPGRHPRAGAARRERLTEALDAETCTPTADGLLERVHVLVAATATATATATARNDTEQPLARGGVDRHLEIIVLSRAGADQDDGRPSGCLGLLHRPLDAHDQLLWLRPPGVVRHFDGAAAPRSARPPFRRS